MKIRSTMKFFIVLFFASYVFSQSLERIERDDIKKLLNVIRHKLICGDAATGLPSFSPLKIKSLRLGGISDNLQGDFTLEDILVYGLPNFDIKVITLIPITFELSWPQPIYIQAEYFGSLKLFEMMKLYGNGSIRIRLNDLFTRATTFIGKTDEGMVNITKVTMPILKFSEDITLIQLTGLFNDETKSSIISQELKEVLWMLIRDYDYKNWLVEALNPVLLPLLNSQINISYDDLFAGKVGPPPAPCITTF